MAGEEFSEFEGGGLMPNTVFPSDFLTASDKLRLQSITGQEDNPRVAVNPYHWYGGERPIPVPYIDPEPILRASERDRYREQPY